MRATLLVASQMGVKLKEVLLRKDKERLQLRSLQESPKISKEIKVPKIIKIIHKKWWEQGHEKVLNSQRLRILAKLLIVFNCSLLSLSNCKMAETAFLNLTTSQTYKMNFTIKFHQMIQLFLIQGPMKHTKHEIPI